MANHNSILTLFVGCLLAALTGCASAPKPASPLPPTSAAVGNNTTIVAIASTPVASSCTLPQFLGLPGIGKGVGGVLHRLGSRLLAELDLTGRFPGLQPMPPVLPLTAPANLEEGAPPAVQAAAAIKLEEDAAPQKIMALRYLATLGCGGCYDKVEDALLEGMSDCTEAVRYEAVKALQCKPECGCKYCNAPSCCSTKIRKRLGELTTCEKEPSERIRRMARIALECCSTKPIDEDDVPREGPPAIASTEQQTRSAAPELFNGIELVSFHSPASSIPIGDMILAEVNGEAIYESQVLPLVDAKLQAKGELVAGLYDAAARRRELRTETYRVIDWKLISQQAQGRVRQTSTFNSIQPMNANEIQAWFERNVSLDTTVSSQQLLAHYEVHRDRYRTNTKVRWEHVVVNVDQCSSRNAAIANANYLKNKAMGLPVEPPAGFSRESVDIFTKGWSDVTAIDPMVIRNTLRSLRPGQVSNPIEDKNRIHVVRVLERQEQAVAPLHSVAEQIRKEILSERKQAMEVRVLSQLRAQSKIWTVFDSAAGGRKTEDNPSDQAREMEQNAIPTSFE